MTLTSGFGYNIRQAATPQYSRQPRAAAGSEWVEAMQQKAWWILLDYTNFGLPIVSEKSYTFTIPILA